MTKVNSYISNSSKHHVLPWAVGNDALGWRYIFVLLTAISVAFTALFIAGMDHANAIIGIPLNGDWSCYRDLGGRNVAEIQDEDIFYHGIGGSLTAVRSSDIVILGPSFSSYAFEKGSLRRFSAAHKVRIYNMSFVGIRSGEFSRQIIRKWHIRPRLWIINVDDQFIHFFSHSLGVSFGPKIEPIKPLSYNRLYSLAVVAVRSLRWRLEDWEVFLAGNHDSYTGLYRNIDTGDIDFSEEPSYLAKNNKKIKVEREQTCHIDKGTLEIAKEFLREIGGHVVFVLVPHSQYCPLQARELANALKVEIIIPPTADYTSCDGGGHLDRRGALQYTSYVVRELEHTEAFKDSCGG